MCARPLIFENEDDQFSYSIHGTAFLVRCKGRYFGITAQHCLRTWTKEAVRLAVDLSKRDFLPMRRLHLGESTDHHDDDYADIALFEVEERLVDTSILHGLHFLDADYFAELRFCLVSNAILALRGYPGELNWVNYDENIIHEQAFAADGHFDGPAQLKHCGRMRFNSLEPIQDTDGLSGSPVFQFQTTPNGLSYLFAGMLIRASKQSGCGSFIEAPVIFSALKRCLR